MRVKISYSAAKKKNVLLKNCYFEALLKRLNTMNYRLEVIQRALEVHIESKRHAFPRFYFISNHELLEILGSSKNLDSVRTHLKKLFNNIHDVKIQVSFTSYIYYLFGSNDTTYIIDAAGNQKVSSTFFPTLLFLYFHPILRKYTKHDGFGYFHDH